VGGKRGGWQERWAGEVVTGVIGGRGSGARAGGGRALEGSILLSRRGRTAIRLTSGGSLPPIERRRTAVVNGAMIAPEMELRRPYSEAASANQGSSSSVSIVCAYPTQRRVSRGAGRADASLAPLTALDARTRRGRACEHRQGVWAARKAQGAATTVCGVSGRGTDRTLGRVDDEHLSDRVLGAVGHFGPAGTFH
jgi:hypothetical protein